MLIACLWSHWEDKAGDDLESFTFITDEPQPEVSAAGHDLCIIPILVCTSGYGVDAYNFSKGKPLELIDGGGLLYLLRQHAGTHARIAI